MFSLVYITICIVIARYNEDIEWSKQFQNVIIYNKGNRLNGKLNGDYNEILMQNVGREGHTYYRHIYDNYDNLADYTIFLQGRPFDHSPNIIANINKYTNDKDLNIDFEFLSECVLECNLSGCKYHDNLPLIDIYQNLFNEKKNDMNFLFGAGAQFIVSKKCILKRPKEFYFKIIELLQENINPTEGYVIERFHKIIFQ
jgi:hypothetical protein